MNLSFAWISFIIQWIIDVTFHILIVITDNVNVGEASL